VGLRVTADTFFDFVPTKHAKPAITKIASKTHITIMTVSL
jgi:hypothetical protein